MMRGIKFFSVIVAFAVTLGASSASAVPVVFCNSGGIIDLVNDGCISGESDFYTPNWDGTYANAGGGDPEAKVEEAIFDATGVAVDIMKYGKSDDNPGLFNLTGVPGQSGTWSVIDGTLISYITVIAANSFALYDVGGVSSGSWTTDGIFTKNKANQPNVSHITFWKGPIAPVPVPAAGLLLAGALGGLGLMRRRKKS